MESESIEKKPSPAERLFLMKRLFKHSERIFSQGYSEKPRQLSKWPNK